MLSWAARFCRLDPRALPGFGACPRCQARPGFLLPALGDACPVPCGQPSHGSPLIGCAMKPLLDEGFGDGVLGSSASTTTGCSAMFSRLSAARVGCVHACSRVASAGDVLSATLSSRSCCWSQVGRQDHCQRLSAPSAVWGWTQCNCCYPLQNDVARTTWASDCVYGGVVESKVGSPTLLPTAHRNTTI